MSREPEKQHDPRYRYDCDSCRYRWCCGYTCQCSLRLEDPPEEVKQAVNAELEEIGLLPEFT